MLLSDLFTPADLAAPLPECLEGTRDTLPCAYCREGCAFFKLETTPPARCGTQGFLPCIGCSGDCRYAPRAEAIASARIKGKWADGRRYRDDGNYFDDPWPEGEGAVEEGLDESLNEAQQRAVEFHQGAVLTIAGAGSGKTRVLIARIARLIEHHGVRPSEICALTFTRKAASQMRQRILQRSGGHAAKELTVTTFHSLALGICREHPECVSRMRGFSVWDDKLMIVEIRRVLNELWEETHADIKKDDQPTKPKPAEVLDQIGKRKAAGLHIKDEAWLSLVRAAFHPVAADAILEYEAAKKASNALDYDDLIWSAVRMLSANPVIRKEYQERWRFLLVDEYQDTNDLQERLLVHLAGGDQVNLMAVGDEDQSIYGFRGANVGHILSFLERYKGSTLIELGQNYRSSKRIVAAAAKLIENNQNRRKKNIHTENAEGWPVEYYTTRNPQDEADYIARVLHGSVQAGHALEEHAVLVRTRRQFVALQAALSHYDLPYQTVGALDFWQRADIKLVLRWMQCLVNPVDFASAAHCFRYWPRIGAKTVQRWQDVSIDAGSGLWRSLSTLLHDKGCSSTSLRGKSIMEFQATYDHLVAFVRRGDSIYDISLYLYRRIGLDAQIVEAVASSGKEADEGRSRAALRTDFLAMCPRECEEGSSGWDHLRGFLDAVLSNSVRDAEEPKIVLSTIHSAKGLEWDHVVVAGMNECILPYSRTEVNKNAVLSDDELEEERRLAYVAYTRAKQRLILTRYNERLDIQGKPERLKPSRFLIEGATPDVMPVKLSSDDGMPSFGIIRVGG